MYARQDKGVPERIARGYLVILLTLVLPFFNIPSRIQAQEVPDEGELIDTLFTSVDLFDETDPMDVTLTFNMREYQRTKDSRAYIPAHFQYHINDTLELEKSMTIRARGEFRRALCSFAPFWLYVQRADTTKANPQEVIRIKIVTHCMGSRIYADYLLKEYLVYKIYNLLHPVSFRVRLLRIKYVDTGRKNKITENWAFMIEPEEMLAERFDAQVIKNDELYMAIMESGTFDLMAMFQYMIGNPDYSVKGRHNVKILGLPGYGSSGYTPVPYDFDYTGLVNADYALVKEELGIHTVTERLFLGLCRDEQRYLATMQQIEDHRSEIMELVNTFPYMGDRPRKEMLKYLESYFKLTSNQKKIISNLIHTCR